MLLGVALQHRVREHERLGEVCHELETGYAGYRMSDRKPGPAWGFDISAMANT